ncbi:MAG TPA: hypothetical protein V6D11_04215 [Waterburya sp.]|jgi:hypothetical protein
MNVKLWNLDSTERQSLQEFAQSRGSKNQSIGNESTPLELKRLLVQAGNWARDYLKNNPNVEKSDRKLCDGIPPQT